MQAAIASETSIVYTSSRNKRQ